MRKIPPWLEGALFGILLIPLIFFLKVTCPLDVGCFADPFLIPLFSPLLIAEGIVGKGVLSFVQEIVFITIFWSCVSSAIRHLFANISRAYKKSSFYESDEDEETEEKEY
jgi:hypothetical protein